MNLRHLLASTGVVAMLATALAAVGPAWAAATTPPWEPDPNSQGSLTFYNAAGSVITEGTDLTHIADFIAASSAGRVAANKATLTFAAPDHTQADSLSWAPGSASAATFYPVSSPASVAAITNPVVTLSGTDGNLQSFLSSVGSSLDQTAGYANLVQVRVKDTGIGAPILDTFWSADIEFNRGTTPLADGLAPGAWKLVYPAPLTPTSVTVPVASPATNPAAHGTAITLTSTASAGAVHPAGSVQFKDGGVNQGSPVAVDASGVALLASFVPTDGAHSFTAVFTPTDTATYSVSPASAALSFTVNPVPKTDTSVTTPSPSTASGIIEGVQITLTSTASAGAAHPAGSVQFKDGGVNQGSPVAVDASGVATLASFAPAAGVHSYTAVFTPTDTATYNVSPASSALPYNVNPVTVGRPLPGLVGAPTIGVARVGAIDVCQSGAWTNATSFGFQWFLDASTVPFASASATGKLPVSYLGHKVTCVVTATNSAGSTASRSAARTVTVGAAPVAKVRAAIMGKPKVGRILTAYLGRWAPTPSRYLFVWMRGTAIVGRAATYKATSKDRRKVISLYVFAVKPGFLTGRSIATPVKIG